MRESTRTHYRTEILRVLREEGLMYVRALPHRVQPPPMSQAKEASEEAVREVRRELEVDGLVQVRKDTSQRNKPLVVELALRGPRQVRGVTIVVDAVGLPAGSVSTEIRCEPADARRLPALVAEAVRHLVAEHSAALNLRGAHTHSTPFVRQSR